WGVFFVALIDCELQQMFWERLHCAVSSAERLNTHRDFLRAHKRRLILRCLNVSSKKGLLRAAEHRLSSPCAQRSYTPLPQQTGPLRYQITVGINLDGNVGRCAFFVDLRIRSIIATHT